MKYPHSLEVLLPRPLRLAIILKKKNRENVFLNGHYQRADEMIMFTVYGGVDDDGDEYDDDARSAAVWTFDYCISQLSQQNELCGVVHV